MIRNASTFGRNDGILKACVGRFSVPLKPFRICAPLVLDER